jgi:hypothetical protein
MAARPRVALEDRPAGKAETVELTPARKAARARADDRNVLEASP